MPLSELLRKITNTLGWI